MATITYDDLNTTYNDASTLYDGVRTAPPPPPLQRITRTPAWYFARPPDLADESASDTLGRNYRSMDP